MCACVCVSGGGGGGVVKLDSGTSYWQGGIDTEVFLVDTPYRLTYTMRHMRGV